MIHVSQWCVTCRIVRLLKALWTHLCNGKGLQLSLVRESICTSLSYSREATKQDMTYSCRSVLVRRAVSSCAASSSLPRKLWSPLWEEAGGRNPSNTLWLHPSPAQYTASRNAFCPDSSQSWGNRGRCERMWLWRSSLGKAAPRSRSAPSGNCTISRGLNKRQMASVAVPDLSCSCEAKAPRIQELP